MSTDPGRTGSNTISRAELGAYFKRRGHDHAGDAAAAVFDNIRAHRGPESEPAEAADPETPLSDAQHAIGQVIRLAESWRMQEGYLDAPRAADALLAICAQWTGGLCLPGEVTPDAGPVSAADRALVARATGGGIRSGEVRPRFSDEDELEAIGTGPLLDPDCRDGKCSSCVGGLCEHECHKEARHG